MNPSDQPIPLFKPTLELDIVGYDKINKAIDKVLKSGFYMSGSEVTAFEERIAEMVGVKYVVAVSSGTTAIELCLKVLDLPLGDSVRLNANTFVAVAEAIVNNGSTPSFIDIDTTNWQYPSINDAMPEVISHLYGNMSKGIEHLCKNSIEDASQSFGATWKGRYLGTFADLAAVSLYPTKNLAAVGDAGMVLTNNEEYYEKLRALRNHGQTAHQQHTLCGTTARMDEMQAAVLNLKLDHFTDFAKQREQIGEWYRSALADLPLQFPKIDSDLSPVPNLIVVRSEHRDNIRTHLAERGVATGVHYPTPIHKMPAYSSNKWAQVELKDTDKLLSQVFTLPLYVGIETNELKRVSEAITSYFDQSGK